MKLSRKMVSKKEQLTQHTNTYKQGTGRIEKVAYKRRKKEKKKAKNEQAYKMKVKTECLMADWIES